MSEEPKQLADLIASVADGGPIDWEALDEVATDAVFRAALEDLRIIAGIAEVHRSQVGDEGPIVEVDRHVASTALGRWGNFLLLEKIGEGTFGEVFHAHDSWLDHGVALKLLKPELVDRSRILHEARTLVKVRHANVVEVYGADFHDGRVGFWMEFIRGHTLAQVVAREGVRSASEAAIMGQDLCRALAAVHATGIVHRDIKAQNVMRQSGTGRLVLMDFGAGELMTEPRTRGHLTGTPLYLAPELFDHRPATFRTDIYALGVLLYYLVTADYPVQGEVIEDLVRAHARGERRHLGDVRPDLPDMFVRVVDTMLSRDPAGRYPTAASVRSALEAVVVPGTPATPVVPIGPGVLPGPQVSRANRALVWSGRIALAAGVVTALGLASTAAFNLTFGRTAGFGAESPFQWFVWGIRSLLSPVVRIGAAVVVLILIVAVVRVVCRLITPVGMAVTRARRVGLTFARERELNDPNLLMQIVTGCGALALAALAWIFWDSVTAFAIYISDARAEQLAAFEPANEYRFDRYGRLLELFLFVYGIAAYVVYRSATRSGVVIQPVMIACALAVPALALLLLRELPYRIVYQNAFERVDLGEVRCYEIGARSEEVLLHCPDVAPPRNQVVSATDPRLRPRGVVESVFTRRDQSQATK